MNSGLTDPPKTREELTEYEQGWAEMMVDIWHEQMSQLKAIDTGHLYASVRWKITEGEVESIEHQFVEYGIYVETGTGREFGYGRDDTTGWLDIKDPEYRREHRLDIPRRKGIGWGGGYTSGMPREKKPWFDKKYLYSIYRLREVLQVTYGEQYQNLTLRALHEVFKPIAKDAYDIEMNTSAANMR